MSHDIYQLPQCTCAALFSTSDALDAHLDEYRARENYLTVQQEICRSHSKANYDDDKDLDVYEDGDRPTIGHTGGEKTHRCPLDKCDRITPFNTRQRLQRHFAQHVKCEEVCVCCHQVSNRVSDYVRHAKGHRDVGTTKAIYIQQMCAELRDRASKDLGLAEGRSKKRAREEANVDLRTPQARKLKLHVVNITMNELGFQPANGIGSFQSPSSEPIPLFDVPQSVAPGGFPNLSTEAFYSEFAEGPTTAADDINFDAPVNGIINFPSYWNRWTDAENMAGNLQS